MELPIKRPEKIKLREINPYLTCYLCKGYLIDATTISECLHSFCRSCIIKFLQENSFCPVCEVIINKAKPNLKLDKTLQDIVYKLVPELFLKEMRRRKQFYQQYPQLASKITPEERGEDTERTIFNPQDFISLSMEYVSDDSSPGAICLPGSKNDLDKNKKLTPEENQALMKRYLQCPGMCRVEVLKKFVRNKYNVDTNLFYIDILYKRVPLPDHYTLIDIAYIYSWKRNEPMKFYFRIIDINKVSERFDCFTASQTPDFVNKTPTRAPRNTGDRVGSARRRESVGNKRASKTNKQPSQTSVIECDKNKNDARVNQPNETRDISSDNQDKIKCDSSKEGKDVTDNNIKTSVDSESIKLVANKVGTSSAAASKPKDNKHASSPQTKMKEGKRVIETKNTLLVSPKTPKSEKCAKSKEVPVEGTLLLKPEIAEQIKNKIQSEKGDNKNSVYTNITLNRTNNVEIITKIQKVSNKEGQPIGLNIIKQTVKKGAKARGGSPAPKVTKKVPNEKKKPETQKIDKKSLNNNKIEVTTKNDKQIGGAKKESSSSEPSAQACNSLEDEKYKFFKSIELTAKNVVESIVSKQGELAKPPVGQKRKCTSPVKNDKAKKAKLEKKPTTKIIIQPKQPTLAKPSIPANMSADQKRNCGLQSLIDSCKINIPSSLSITIKESSENRLPVLVPPVKNYIEILKLPDENNLDSDNNDNKEAGKQVEPSSTLCDNDSEQKVDQDLSEIAKSLTEKIPMSTTVSQIIGHKPQFPIPVKSNVSVKFHIQPSPVPEVPCKVLNMPKENKLSPRSPQTFQKIFEESIKKPDGTTQSPEKDPQKSALDLSNEPSAAAGAKRNILEIASQLYKKTKLEHEKHVDVKAEETTTPAPVPKVPIPRLPNQRTLKPPQKNSKFEVIDSLKFPQTLTNLHSNTLGLNYTISVGQSVTPKVNGVVSPVKMDSETKPATETPAKSPGFAASSPNSFVPPIELPSSSPRPSSISRNKSPSVGCNSPRNSPRHSPKSSPMVKHMYAPMPTVMDQLRVHTFNQKASLSKLNSLSKLSPKLQTSAPKLPSPSKSTSSSPKLLHVSPKLPVSSLKVPTSPQLTNASPKSSLPQPSSSIPGKPPQVGASPKNVGASPSSSKNAQKATQGDNQSSPLSPNQILEKYNIQNLAQLTASLNFNSGNFGLNPGNQLAALQHAMLLKHFEMQNRQNWLNMNQGPLLQYEKYLQSLKSNQNHLLGNIKEN